MSAKKKSVRQTRCVRILSSRSVHVTFRSAGFETDFAVTSRTQAYRAFASPAGIGQPPAVRRWRAAARRSTSSGPYLSPSHFSAYPPTSSSNRRARNGGTSPLVPGGNRPSASRYRTWGRSGPRVGTVAVALTAIASRSRSSPAPVFAWIGTTASPVAFASAS